MLGGSSWRRSLRILTSFDWPDFDISSNFFFTRPRDPFPFSKHTVIFDFNGEKNVGGNFINSASRAEFLFVNLEYILLLFFHLCLVSFSSLTPSVRLWHFSQSCLLSLVEETRARLIHMFETTPSCQILSRCWQSSIYLLGWSGGLSVVWKWTLWLDFFCLPPVPSDEFDCPFLLSAVYLEVSWKNKTIKEFHRYSKFCDKETNSQTYNVQKLWLIYLFVLEIVFQLKFICNWQLNCHLTYIVSVDLFEILNASAQIVSLTPFG